MAAKLGGMRSKMTLGSIFWIGLLVVFLNGGQAASLKGPFPSKHLEASTRLALDFLEEQVASWPRENGCFSCHNNSDAPQTLFAARQYGWDIAGDSISSTLDWLSSPEKWDKQQGDPNVSDQQLADVQFASALVKAVSAGVLGEEKWNRSVARKLVGYQTPEGNWVIEKQDSLGSPAAPGHALATLKAWTYLNHVSFEESEKAVNKAAGFLRNMPLESVSQTAAKLLFIRASGVQAGGDAVLGLEYLMRAQTTLGGWGPYPHRPPEVFDTALALLAMLPHARDERIAMIMNRGLSFLIAEQLQDGSWRETTRPSGEESHAQWISTSAWATMALLEIHQFQKKETASDDQE